MKQKQHKKEPAGIVLDLNLLEMGKLRTALQKYVTSEVGSGYSCSFSQRAGFVVQSRSCNARHLISELTRRRTHSLTGVGETAKDVGDLGGSLLFYTNFKVQKFEFMQLQHLQTLLGKKNSLAL